jgi:hypothetical protein
VRKKELINKPVCGQFNTGKFAQVP